MKTCTPRTRLRAPIRALLLSGALLMASTLITGCSGTSSSSWGLRKGGLRARMVLAELERRVSIEHGPVTRGPLTGFDISNPGGAITIIVDQRYPDATIHSQVRYEDRHRQAAADEGWEFDFRGPWFTAVHEQSAENGRVVIRPTDNVLADGTRPFVDLVIRTPVCDGVRVLNRYGEVEIRGARGEITIDTSSDVTLSTAHRLIDKLTVRSSGGSIDVITVPESSGTFLLTAPNGRASFNSNFGEVQQARPRVGEWSGIWNGGANPVTLHSDHGNVTYFVTETPRSMTIGPLY
ncbi:MAG: hypothetical protein ACI89L_000214 [Phycisphaerales bacterium]|jgi:hypothetical protein